MSAENGTILACRPHGEFRLTQEVACDELAVLSTEALPVDYGAMLLEVAKTSQSGPCRGAAAVCVVESCSTLKRRLREMRHFAHVPRRHLMVAASALLVLATVGIAPWRLVSADAQETAPKQAVEKPTIAPETQHLIDQLATEDAPGLVQALEDQNTEVRWRAALALVDLVKRSKKPGAVMRPAIAPLTEAVRDGEIQMRWDAARALGSIADRLRDGAALSPAVAPLIAMLSDGGAETRGAFPAIGVGRPPSTDYKLCGVAAWALATMATSGANRAVLQPAIPRLVEMLGDEEENIVGYATMALGAMARGSDTAVLGPAIPRLIELLDSQAWRTAESAAKAIWGIARDVEDEAALQPAVPRLINLLGDERPNVSFNASKALAAIAFWTGVVDEATLDSAAEALIETMRDKNRGVVLASLGGLASSLRDAAVLKPVLPIVVDALDDGSLGTQLRTLQLLTKITARSPDEAALKAAISWIIVRLAEPRQPRYQIMDSLRYLARQIPDKALLVPAILPLVGIVEELPEERPAGLAPSRHSRLESTAMIAVAALAEIAPLVEDDEALEAAIPTMLKVAQHSSTADKLRWRAAWALGSIAIELQDQQMLETAVTILIRALNNGGSEGAYEGSRGLVAFAECGVGASLLEPAIKPMTSFAKSHERKVVSTHSSRFLALVAIELQDQQMLETAVMTLLETFKVFKGAPWHQGRCELLRRLAVRAGPSAAGLEPAIPLLTAALEAPTQAMREQAVAALEAIGTPKAKAALRAHGG